MQLTRVQRIALFLAIAYIGSGSLALTFWAFGGQWGSPLSKPVGVLYLLPPALAALLVQGAISGGRIIEPFGLHFPRNKWFAIAWLLPVIMLMLGTSLDALLGYDVVTSSEQLADAIQARASPEQRPELRERLEQRGTPSPLLLIAWAMLAGVTIDQLLALGEELGWRGFLLAELPGSFWFRSLTIGLVWGLWLLPIVVQGHLHPEHPLIGAVLVMVWTALLSPIVTYVRLRGRSLFAATVLRGTAMALWPVGADLLPETSSLAHPVYGVPGLLAAAIVLGALWVFDTRFARDPLMHARRATRA